MGFEQQSGMCRPMCTRLNRKTGHLRAANLILDRQRGTWRLAGAGGVRACVGRSTRARSGSIIPWNTKNQPYSFHMRNTVEQAKN